jgi:hypothetical protein
VNLPPIVHVHLPPHVFQREIHETTIQRDRRVVDPRIDAAELGNRRVRNALNVLRIRNVGNDRERPAAAAPDFANGLFEVRFVACGKDNASATLGGAFAGDKADAARPAGDHHDLFVMRKQPGFHG